MKYLLGLDIGTSSVKGALFDATGTEISVALKEYDLEKSSAGIVELDPEIYWQSVKSIIRRILKDTKIEPLQIASVGVTSQGETLICVDSDGRLLRKAIVWMDIRAKEEARVLSAFFGPKKLYEVTGQHEAIPGYTAVLIKWLSSHEPEIFKRTAKFLLVGDFIISRLTGQYVTDRALVPSTLLFNMRQSDWWDLMLDYLRISRKQLPKLLDSGTVVGKVTDSECGLSTETLVCSAPIDQVTGAIGSGNIHPGIITETTGTTLSVCACTDHIVYDPERRISVFAHGIQDKYVLLPWAPVGGMLLRWFRDEFASDISFEELSNMAGDIVPGSGGLIILPHFAGSGGVFYGITLSHGKAHFVRAIMESIAFLLRDNLETLKQLDIDTSKVVSLGGGSHSECWLQIKADVLNRKITTLDCEETTCLGAAMLAAIGAGIYPNIETAVTNMVKFKKHFVPNPLNTGLYDALFSKYRELNNIYKLNGKNKNEKVASC